MFLRWVGHCLLPSVECSCPFAAVSKDALLLLPFCEAGCIKFLESYYLILVTRRRQIGCICGHAIYCIDESQMITIPHTSVQTDVATSKNELRYNNKPIWLSFTLLKLYARV